MTESVPKPIERACSATFLLVALAGCHTVEGSGHVVSEEREISDVDRVSLRGRGTISYTQAPETSLVIEAEDNIVKRLTSRVEDHKLILRERENVILNPTEPIRYHLTAPTLVRVALDGSGRFVTDALEVSQTTFELDGSSEAIVRGLVADELTVEVDGSSKMTVGGVVGSQIVEVDGSSRYKAFDLESARADLEVDGSAKAFVHVTDELRVEVDGSGHVDYRGEPSVRRDVDDSGELHAVD